VGDMPMAGVTPPWKPLPTPPAKAEPWGAMPYIGELRALLGGERRSRAPRPMSTCFSPEAAESTASICSWVVFSSSTTACCTAEEAMPPTAACSNAAKHHAQRISPRATARSLAMRGAGIGLWLMPSLMYFWQKRVIAVEISLRYICITRAVYMSPSLQERRQGDRSATPSVHI
jgi:hypothetical protein